MNTSVYEFSLIQKLIVSSAALRLIPSILYKMLRISCSSKLLNRGLEYDVQLLTV